MVHLDLTRLAVCFLVVLLLLLICALVIGMGEWRKDHRGAWGPFKWVAVLMLLAIAGFELMGIL